MMTQFSEELNNFIKKLNNSNQHEKNSLITFCKEISRIKLNRLFENLGSEDYFLWNQPSEEFYIFAVDECFRFNSRNYNEPEDLETHLFGLKKNWVNNFELSFPHDLPIYFGATKFNYENSNSIWSNFSNETWVIPKFLIVNNKKDFYLIYNFRYSELCSSDIEKEYDDFLNKIFNISLSEKGDSELIKAEIRSNHETEKQFWNDSVERALEEIENGTYSKVVLSRSIEIDLEKEPNVIDLVNELADNYPKCYVFAYKNEDSVFFGATPEKLVKVQKGLLETDALAGSISRGNDEKEDRKLEYELLSSKKNIYEQRAVLDYITEKLSEFSDHVEFDEIPKVRKLSNIQHLWTPIKAKIKTEENLLQIIRKLHPTPAICGVPCGSAKTSIGALENYQRGLFSGLIGWGNFFNEGEFAVSIRSALMRNKKLYAFAGCGIVDGSDPESEYRETELKLNPILSLFDYNGKN